MYFDTTWLHCGLVCLLQVLGVGVSEVGRRGGVGGEGGGGDGGWGGRTPREADL